MLDLVKIIYLIIAVFFTKNILAAESFKLDNGMQIIAIKNEKIAAVSHMIIYKIGSNADPIGKSGLAHFVEHMMFKSTGNLKEGDFFRIIAENGGKLNAFTNLSHTGYYELIAKDKLSLVMQMEANRMNKLNLNFDEVAKERNVIIQERSLRTDNIPKNLLYEQIYAALYINHQNHRPVVGFRSEIENLQLEDVRKFHNSYYIPSNAILVIAGDINFKILRSLAQKYYGKLKNPKIIDKPVYTVESPQIAARNITYCDQRSKTESLIRVFQVPIINDFKDEIIINLISYILGGNDFSKFYQYFVREKNLANNVSTDYYNNSKYSPGVFAIDIDTSNIENLILKLNEQITTLLDNGFTQKELNIAKTSLITNHIYKSESFRNLAYEYAYMAINDIDFKNFNNYSEIVKSIDLEQINKMLRKIFEPSRSVTAKLYNEPAKCKNYAN